MKLEGIHHVTAITGDAPRNVEFYTSILGLRLVKKTVNQDDPTVYHLFYADDKGSPGSDLTFFEYPGAPKGRPGEGMVYRIAWRVASEGALDFWNARLRSQDIETWEGDGLVRFRDFEGLELEIKISPASDPPLTASHTDIPLGFALQGFDGVRAFASDPARSVPLLGDVLGFQGTGDSSWESRGAERGSFYAYDEPPSRPGLGGAGTVHHVAWACRMEEHSDWRARLADSGVDVTPVIDRFYFKSIYFREPSGVLFEIATMGPGFTADEPLDSLGQALSLPPKFEPLRSHLEHALTPLPVPGSAPSS